MDQRRNGAQGRNSRAHKGQESAMFAMGARKDHEITPKRGWDSTNRHRQDFNRGAEANS